MGPGESGIQDGSDSVQSGPVQLLPLVIVVEMNVQAAFQKVLKGRQFPGRR